MEPLKAAINNLLVEVFNDILSTEESELKKGYFHDVTISEIHTVEVIGMYEKKNMGEIAKSLRITMGTLTVAIDHLVKKGYAERFRNENDRRVVMVGLTNKGKLLYRAHQHFHTQMVNEATSNFTDEECEVFKKALTKIHNYFLKSNM